MAKNIINQWDSNFLNNSLIFADLKVLLRNTPLNDWPGCHGLLELLPQPVILSSGFVLDMKPQDDTLPYPEMAYEERVYKKGIISTREQNWHDLFNAFIWLLFPKTKALLNALHMQELEQQSGNKRTPVRDAITHLDESGIIVASSDRALIKALKNHQWQDLFVRNRQRWWHDIGAFVFGHGMYEKAFKPFIGFTGKAYCIEVDSSFYQNDKLTQYQILDKLLSDDIKSKRSLTDSSILSPIPILGVPHWSDDNINPDYYNNQRYFRAKA